MKELLEAAAAAGVADLPYRSHYEVKIGKSGYTINLPHLVRSVRNSTTGATEEEYLAVDCDMDGCFGGIYIALDHPELLFSDDSLLTQAAEEAGINDFKNYVVLPFRERQKSQEPSPLRKVRIFRAGIVLAQIADTLQSSDTVRDIDRAFWNEHLKHVQNIVTFRDAMNFSHRAENHNLDKKLYLRPPGNKMAYPIAEPVKEETPPPVVVSVAAPLPDPAAEAMEDELVRLTYAEELNRLQTGSPHPPVYEDKNFHEKDIAIRLEAAMQKARADFEAARKAEAGTLPPAVAEEFPVDAPLVSPPPPAAPAPRRDLWPDTEP